MRRFPIVPLLLVLAAAAACASAPEDAALEGAEAGRSVRFEELLATVSSCHGAGRDEAAVRDAAGWEAWWRETACGSAGPPPVDFSRDMVLAIRDLEGPTGCYRARIADVKTDVGGGLRVLVRRQVPKSRTPCPMVVVHPAHAVRVPLARGPVRFEWSVVTGEPRAEPEGP